jgi:hypothetical protein
MLAKIQQTPDPRLREEQKKRLRAWSLRVGMPAWQADSMFATGLEDMGLDVE